ncbi:uncharacterized protein LOC134233834 [Saccostrea cucullata]|uniref:uncharacterized protein LOC134233834 n=1 Tax=Saccostrea cuccullata TaxID=36930 RepID=UPI002ED13D8B
MNLRKTKLFKTINTGNPKQVMGALWEYLKTGKDVNLRDEETGGNLLHLLVNHGENFADPETVQAIYMLVCKDIDIDATDNTGETGLHKVMRKKGTYRIMMALIRCGADTRILNNDGKTAEDVLLTEKPEGWEEMYHWYKKFKPGLWAALSEENPDRKLVQRLLRQWCRLTCVKNGKVVNVKSLVKDDIHKVDLLHMIEEYENPNEMCLALNAGFGFIVKSWVKQGIELLKGVDCDAKDYSYQHKYPEFPEVPRPILAAAWESNNYDAVDVLLDMEPDTRVLWTDDTESKNPPKPLFFQIICGVTAPRDEKIVHRVLKGSDLTARDREGHTILHKIIIHDRPENAAENTLRVAMSYGADIAARDCNGRTPRDLAQKLQKEHYCKCIDEYIIKLVKDRRFDDIEKLILHNYNHLLDITDSGNRTLVEIAKKYGTRQIHEVVKLTAAIQAYVKRIFQAVDEGSVEDIKKLLSCKRYANVRDKCGRSLLHRAILKKQKPVISFLLEECPNHVTTGDTLDFTPLHYSYLFIPEEKAIIKKMIDKGALVNRRDAFGRLAADLSVEKCGSQDFGRIKKEVEEFDLNIYLTDSDFEQTFKTAIQTGDFETVKSLMSGLQAFGDVTRYSSTLFDCVDNKQTDIAKFLITNGFKTDIYKQYQKCDPNDPMCAMMECGHSMTSLKERAIDKKCDEVVKLIEEVSLGKVKVQNAQQNGLSMYGV